MDAVSVTKHLLILCCYGGSPFVDLQLPDQPKVVHRSTHSIDPTDWIAVDTSGSELNSSLFEAGPLKPFIRVPNGVSIKKCDLYNLTFTNIEDEKLFSKYEGKVQCRCPGNRWGSACEYDAETDPDGKLSKSTFSTVATLLILSGLAAIFALLLTMMRCGFCDCFGPFRSPFSKDDLEEPLDQNTLNRCLELLKAHEQRTSIAVRNDCSRPLISTVSQGLESYNPPAQPQHSCRSCSPPPPYQSLSGSLDSISAPMQNQQNRPN